MTIYLVLLNLQVGKAYFELVDYLEADRAFTLARRVSPYSLEGMDIYSTVLYVSPSNLGYFSTGISLVSNILGACTELVISELFVLL